MFKLKLYVQVQVIRSSSLSSSSSSYIVRYMPVWTYPTAVWGPRRGWWGWPWTRMLKFGVPVAKRCCFHPV